MKKLLLCICILAAGIFTSNAQQISENAIGLRLGINDGTGAEITYQRALKDTNRLEIDLGIRGNSSYSFFKVNGLYEWVWQLEDKFNWYLGAGGGIGNTNYSGLNNSNTFIFGSGIVGIEYNFDIPLLVSLDFRPEFGFNDSYNGFNTDFGLSVRYQF